MKKYIGTTKNGVLNVDTERRIFMYQRRPNKPRRVIHSIDELPVLCDCAEAGLLLRRNPEVVAKMAREGVIPGAKQGQTWYFRRDDLVAYMDRLFGGGTSG